MEDPVIVRRKPYLVELKQGKSYLWCTCGRSKTQPFCDGSHKLTEFQPLKWVAEETGEKLLCACKHTAAQPFCDGSHNRLSDTYAEASEDDGVKATVVNYLAAAGGALKAHLDNGCYVIRVPGEAMQAVAALKIFPLIDAGDGAEHLSQFYAVVETGESPILRYPGSDVVLFTLSGCGDVTIGGRAFPVAPGTGVCIKPGEGFQIASDGTQPIALNISVCPQCETPEYLDEMPVLFDASVPERTQGVDESNREVMGDRFFQVLIDDQSHHTPVTQFIGEIPRSRAAHHRHLYEETITILSGEGFLWTDQTRAPVQPGDTIFLPLKQAHSLECTSDGGMQLIGVFYPSMSPAINY